MAEKLTKVDDAYRAELAEANINPDSFLATDYLNHFNEIVMLLEMAIDMPDLMEEARDWKPATYEEHFEGSGFVARELVIEAFGLAPQDVRASFEGVVSQLDQLILSVLELLTEAVCQDGVFDDQTRAVFADSQTGMQEFLLVLNGIIHNGQDDGASTSKSFDPADEFEEAPAGSSEAQSQDAIDQLFD